MGSYAICAAREVRRPCKVQGEANRGLAKEARKKRSEHLQARNINRGFGFCQDDNEMSFLQRRSKF